MVGHIWNQSSLGCREFSWRPLHQTVEGVFFLRPLLEKIVLVLLGSERSDCVPLPRHSAAMTRHRVLPDSPLPAHNYGIFPAVTAFKAMSGTLFCDLFCC
jgi:hypothetical protein